MDQFLPQSQCFLANVVLEIPWPFVPNLDLRTLLSLFIKLSNQPNMRKVLRFFLLLLLFLLLKMLLIIFLGWKNQTTSIRSPKICMVPN